ncbi:hypothetical protein BPOR_0126g00130 [Botrytis porri]|uniref:Uncharacterized protein n=1 Tax=Botrytis porri TaxID=87229 RepID=A0A4Z1KX39_9HELO|nr:hypothetical protein BPOR_0126g00130 [Botrytis porri]
MPTPLDRALSSKAILAFTGIVTAAAAWSIWGTDMFPKEEDPTGERSSSTTQGYQRAVIGEGKGQLTSAKKVMKVMKAIIPTSYGSFEAGG